MKKNHDIWSTLINCFISFWNVCYFSRERHAQHKSIIAMMLEWVFDILTLIRVFLLKICSHIDFILHFSNAKPLLIEVTMTTFSSICYTIINFMLYATTRWICSCNFVWSFFVSAFFSHYLHRPQASQLSFYIYTYQPFLYTYLHDDDDEVSEPNEKKI